MRPFRRYGFPQTLVANRTKPFSTFPSDESARAKKRPRSRLQDIRIGQIGQFADEHIENIMRKLRVAVTRCA